MNAQAVNLPAKSKTVKWLKGALIALLVYHIFWMAQGFRRSADQKAIFGVMPRHQYLDQKLGYWNALGWINANTPVNSRVLLLGETRAYGFQRPLLVVTVHDRHPLAHWAENSGNAEKLLDKLKKEGIGHIFHNRQEETRISGYPMFHLNPQGRKVWDNFRGLYLRNVYHDSNVVIYKVLQ